MFKKFAMFAFGSFITVLPVLAQAQAAAVAAPTAVAAAQKRKITVMDFGYATVRSAVQAYFGTDQDIGKGISDQIIDQLLAGGNFRIIERSALEKIIKEQNFSNSDRANASTAAKIGGLLGADAMIIGDITTFGNDDKHYGGAGGGASGWRGGLGAIRVNNSKTIVEITARIVDVNTGEILASVSGQGEVKKSGLGVAGGGGNGWGTGGGGGFDMGSSKFKESAIGQAVKLSVTDLATKLDAKAPVIPVAEVKAPPPPPPAPPLDGVIADTSTPEIILNVGSKDGVKVGDTLSVMRIGKTIKDPVSGKVLRSIKTPVGTLSVTSVDPDSAVGKFSGTGAPKVGDHVERPPAN